MRNRSLLTIITAASLPGCASPAGQQGDGQDQSPAELRSASTPTPTPPAAAPSTPSAPPSYPSPRGDCPKGYDHVGRSDAPVVACAPIGEPLHDHCVTWSSPATGYAYWDCKGPRPPFRRIDARRDTPYRPPPATVALVDRTSEPDEDGRRDVIDPEESPPYGWLRRAYRWSDGAGIDVYEDYPSPLFERSICELPPGCTSISGNGGTCFDYARCLYLTDGESYRWNPIGGRWEFLFSASAGRVVCPSFDASCPAAQESLAWLRRQDQWILPESITLPNGERKHSQSLLVWKFGRCIAYYDCEHVEIPEEEALRALFSHDPHAGGWIHIEIGRI